MKGIRFQYQRPCRRAERARSSNRTVWCTPAIAGISWPGTSARKDWRTFRVDRIEGKLKTSMRFKPRKPPEGDFAALFRSPCRRCHIPIALA